MLCNTACTPNIRQNTANMKLNFGVTDSIELDLDNRVLGDFPARTFSEPRNLNGIADTNLGVKWNFHKENQDSRSAGAQRDDVLRIPTGDTSRQLGSGLIDYWLNGIVQKSISERTKITANLGILFAGNTAPA